MLRTLLSMKLLSKLFDTVDRICDTKKSKSRFFQHHGFYQGQNCRENDLMTKNVHNIKLQSIPAFFADARADAHEKMRVRLQFFFVVHHSSW